MLKIPTSLTPVMSDRETAHSHPGESASCDGGPTVISDQDTPTFPLQQALLGTGPENEPRWRPSERLNNLFEVSLKQFGNNTAIFTNGETISYDVLDQRANQMARYLVSLGIKPGDRLGLMFEKSAETYVALLAVLKAHAVYVPFDPGFPAHRVRFIAEDAGIKVILTTQNLKPKLDGLAVEQVLVDVARPQIDAFASTYLTDMDVAAPADDVCYIIYTSGTTGNPKGVIIEHASICNFVRVAATQYGYAAGDRVYQGMTIAFDFSVEEIWVPLMVGATLVPAPPGPSLIGEELGAFLHEQEVTCLACCPTLLSTIEHELPHLRVLLVGGEACAQNLVTRWYRPGLSILNSYGPTEATVTAMLTELLPEKPVTIGKPLPTYSILILDANTDEIAPYGQVGEISIAGIGLAKGYLNQEDLTHAKFVPDFIGIPNNPSQRIYRTGDLGRVNDDGEVEFLGRIDTQVKIRGYRIELTEIESALMEIPQIAQATMATYEPEPGTVELVAYFALKQDAEGISSREIAQILRGRLPAYMVPAYFEQLDAIPMSVSNKADHKKLPPPKGTRHTANDNFVAPRSTMEHDLSRTLAEILKLKQVSVDHDFFTELGANSLLMARFCAKVRKNAATAGISMQDIYLHPSVAKLAEHLHHLGMGGSRVLEREAEVFHRPTTLAYWTCGAGQLAYFAAYILLVMWVFSAGVTWTNAVAGNLVEHYYRAAIFSVATFAGLSALPIVAKWLLIGRWQKGSFPIWGFAYYRFWVVKNLVRTAPAAMFSGRPLLNVYLRLLGAKIGKNVVLEAKSLPVTTDLFTIADNSIVRKDSVLLGYRAQSNYIYTGSVTIGNHAFVGEGGVLDINSAMGDHTQLGHASSLQSGQIVPHGKHYHGSPAVETTSNYCPIEPRDCTMVRRCLYTAFELAGLLLIVGPLSIIALEFFYNNSHLAHAAGASNAISMSVVGSLLLNTATYFFGGLLIGLPSVFIVPRLAQRFLEEGKTYPLFGFHYFMQRIVSTFSNAQIYNSIFGDSSFIIGYLRYVGWKLENVEQTGSNFGSNQKHDNPFMCEIGGGTMVSDGLSMINTHVSSTSFSLQKTRISESNYLGNGILYPPDGRTGPNCLLGTKVLVPIDGPVRENVGLLGSPSFEIPRIVDRDKILNASVSPTEQRRAIRAKNMHNLTTIGLFLASQWLYIFMSVLLFYIMISSYYASHGIFALLLTTAFQVLLSTAYIVFVVRASTGFKPLVPRIVTIYDGYFWRHERHWKLADSLVRNALGGTPFKNLILRLYGVKVGRMVYDGGSSMTEHSLTEIDDYACINEGCVLQAHSLEEGVFKSDFIKIGKGCSIGPSAFVHYGVSLGDYSILDADSFLMKGERLDPCTRWRGNPAKLYQTIQIHDVRQHQVAAASTA